jgi:NADPH2:quinone reductase
VVPAWQLVVVPPDIDSNTGVALMLQGCTAHYLTHSLFSLSTGDWCLVHAGAGGVGQLLVQLAGKRGAQVITTVGTPEKAEIVKRLGADHAVLYREVDFFEAVQSVTKGQGVDVVYDAVGKQTIASSIRCLKRRGTCVNYGGSSGLVETVSPLALADAGSVFFTRPHLAHYMADQVEIQGRCTDLFGAVGNGTLSVTIDQVFELSAFAEAHARLESRGTLGKLLLRV